MQGRSEAGTFSTPYSEGWSLTQEYLKSILEYNPETGLFTWLVNYHSRMIGKEAGTGSKGYKYIVINKKKYLAHRLAFLYMLGYIPDKEIDHKDGIKDNNAWLNLREATPRQNMANRVATKRSKTGVKGVSFHEKSGVYQVHISLGCYDTLEEAKKVYDETAKKLHGDFFRS